jgi:acyl-CoA thioesterase YciA
MWPYTADEVESLAGPRGELAARTVAMPADTNPAGDIFGGWIMSLMDTAGMVTAARHAKGRVVTVSVTDMAFHFPVKVGDVVCCYAEIAQIKRTSATFHLEVWVLRAGESQRLRVTSADFTFVALDEKGKPRLFAANEI